MDRQYSRERLPENIMTRLTMSVVVLVTLFAGGYAWGGLFNRFSNDMLANLGYGRSPYRHYPYGQVEPDEGYAEAMEGNRIDDVVDEPVHCYSSPCVTNGDCCRGLMCLETDDGGRCLPAFAGRKMGEICNRENQCDAGLICEEVAPGEHVCRPPSAGRKQYNDDCGTSAECDVTRGLCCIMQRRHRQKPRKSCGYFKEPLVCIGPVATDQIREFVQHTNGEKRIGAYRLH